MKDNNDTHFVNRFCNGNTNAAINEHQQKYR